MKTVCRRASCKKIWDKSEQDKSIENSSICPNLPLEGVLDLEITKIDFFSEIYLIKVNFLFQLWIIQLIFHNFHFRKFVLFFEIRALKPFSHSFEEKVIPFVSDYHSFCFTQNFQIHWYKKWEIWHKIKRMDKTATFHLCLIRSYQRICEFMLTLFFCLRNTLYISLISIY